ncbi:Electron transfer DM13 [Flaviramulus basaltis]|uniref:Electron transfer DM13 n=1 Tax=Flaviramulus basaltis TaxID=369401 RepID=A0A1K2IGM1_9FLAO|nr:DM13 domain-containing protein [Flaviramulus basaltis]SFZ91418.1 Electron transfer DM13 [Flaviramulus basaltis]
MRLFLLFFVSSMFFSACSSDNSPMKMDEEVMEEEEMMDDEMMGEEMTTNAIYGGDFVSAAHPTMGMVSVNPEKTILNIKGFKTDSGPVLEMYLATSTNANTFISLGVLKGLDGDYEYTLPDNVDFDIYKYVMVWCVEYSINFGHAILSKT